MSDQATVRIEGLSRFRSTLKAAGADMADMKAANERAGATVAAAAVALAPRRSGDLAASMQAGRRLAGARVQSAVAYAGVIHWGWPARGITPNRFLVAAASLTQSVWLHDYEQDLQRIADSVKGT